MSSLLDRLLRLLGGAVHDAAVDAGGSPPESRAGGQDRLPRGGSPSESGTTEPKRSGRRRDVEVYDVAALGPPEFTYSPNPDGEPDPGEIVWTWVPYEEDASRGKDRPVLVLAHEADAADRLVVAQMTSKDHDRDAAQEARWGRHWHDVGTGDWDPRRRPSEVRLDRLLSVDAATVRREGATMRRDVFDGVVAALRLHRCPGRE